MWSVHIVTLFPEMFPGPLGCSIAGAALKNQTWDLRTINIRDFSSNKHHKVDDYPYGGGTGLVMQPQVVHDAMTAALKDCHQLSSHRTPQCIYMSPRGIPLTQSIVQKFAQNTDGLIILCGRYEGVDQRVIDYWSNTHGLIEISMGDYVLSGGEIAAMGLIDSCVRLLPGVLEQPAQEIESFTLDLLEFSQYTRPKVWNYQCVPPVLLSGNHQDIAQWRQQEAKKITQQRRPDLWSKHQEKIISKDKE